MKRTNSKFSLDVSALPDVIDNKGEIIMNLLAGAPTLAGLVPMLGAKANTQVQLNILKTGVTWNTGDCVSSITGLTGSTTIKPRYVDVVRLTDREEICLDKLDAKLPMIMSAGARNEDLPFADKYIDLKVSHNSKQLEKLAFRGNYGSATGNLATTDGWLEIAANEKLALQHSATYSAFLGNEIATIEEILNNRSDEMYEMEDFKIYLSLADFSALSKALIDTFGIAGTGNFVNTGDENQNGIVRMKYPGTNVEIIGTHGLNGADAILATNASNLRYATDLEGDSENVELFFDKYHKQLVSDIIFAIGFQYEFPENVILLEKA